MRSGGGDTPPARGTQVLPSWTQHCSPAPPLSGTGAGSSHLLEASCWPAGEGSFSVLTINHLKLCTAEYNKLFSKTYLLLGLQLTYLLDLQALMSSSITRRGESVLHLQNLLLCDLPQDPMQKEYKSTSQSSLSGFTMDVQLSIYVNLESVKTNQPWSFDIQDPVLTKLGF